MKQMSHTITVPRQVIRPYLSARRRLVVWWRRHVWDARWGWPGRFELVLAAEVEARVQDFRREYEATLDRMLFNGNESREFVGLRAFLSADPAGGDDD